MKLRLNSTYPNAFITTHSGLVVKHDEVVEWDKPIDREIRLYIDQKYLIVEEESIVPKVGETSDSIVSKNTPEKGEKSPNKGLTTEKVLK